MFLIKHCLEISMIFPFQSYLFYLHNGKRKNVISPISKCTFRLNSFMKTWWKNGQYCPVSPNSNWYWPFFHQDFQHILGLFNRHSKGEFWDYPFCCGNLWKHEEKGIIMLLPLFDPRKMQQLTHFFRFHSFIYSLSK